MRTQRLVVGDVDQCLKADLLDHEATDGEKFAGEIAKETLFDLFASASKVTQIHSADVT